ncbi:MAG: formate dehydrogenase [Burkholderiales bacterium]|nr:formate dehydrogenase [Burkholderiales bacterium]
MNEKSSKLSRRAFLLSVGAGGAAAGAAMIAGKQKAPAGDASASNDKRGTRGYQETAHVKNYYRTTQV